MNSRSRRLRFLILVAALVPAGLFATEPSPVPAPPPGPATTAEHQTPSLISLDFPGGTVGDLVAALAKPGGTTFNLVAEKRDLATALPAFSVRNVDPSALARALSVLLEPSALEFDRMGPDFFVLRKTRFTNPTAPLAFASFQLWPQLQYQSIDEIADAVRSAWTLDAAHAADDLKLKFHPATSLLLVSGPQEAIHIATQVIGSLKAAPLVSPPPKSTPPAASPR